ncbi:MAG: glycosyltransferase family 4 protein [Flammeovirgaceae bacterium]|nr:MAG: glycosyltransferase family 4 protein [Flammeovirgaceae bacterium]
MNKRVLIITYYWPPSGGSGVQRWLKFVKYLPQFGWEPFVFTPENPSFELKDESLLKDVPPEADIIKLPIWEPYSAYARLSGWLTGRPVKSSDYVSTGKKSVFQTIAAFIRGNFFIPDPKIFWKRPAVKFLNDFIQHNHIRIIVTTGPPHSMHLIGLALKKKNPSLKWIADFRDPWSRWDLLDTLHLTLLARARHRQLEHRVLVAADGVLTVTPHYVNWFKELGARKTVLITNGYDEDDFSNLCYSKGNKFTVRHLGVVDELRDPRPFMLAAREACKENNELAAVLAIEFVGQVNSAFQRWVQADDVLSRITSFRNQVPHGQLVDVYNQTDVLLLVLANSVIAPGNIPGKLFEYLGSKRPILGIGPADGDAASILSKTGAGIVVERNNLQEIKAGLLRLFSGWKNNTATTGSGVEHYSRRSLTAELAALLNSL